jgi:uncharacterized linocin/CFP29 family protein
MKKYMLPDNAYNLYYETVLEAIEPLLIGPRVVAKADSLPPGTQQITRDELQKLRGKAKRGRKGSPVPRELGELERKTTYIPEHIHGFDVHNQDLLASKRSNTPLPQAAAMQCSRLVAESIEDMIFNGIPELNIKGIYKDAGKIFKTSTSWNTEKADPYTDIVNIVGQLNESSRYKPKMMVLGSNAYWSLFKTNNMGVSYMKMIEDAGIFPNGRNDIYMAPAPANPDSPLIIPPTDGVIGDFGNNIAERYVQNGTGKQNTNKEYPSEIDLIDFPMDKNNLWAFNVQTYQGLDIHYKDAYIKLENLTKT